MLRILIATLILLVASLSALAQDKTLQLLLVEQHEAIQKPSRGSVDVLVAALMKSGLPEAKIFLLKWRDREVWVRKSDGAFFLAKPDGDLFQLIDVTTGAPAGAAKKGEIGQLKPNSGVQAVVSSALVQFQLSDPDVTVRSDALGAIEKDPQPSQLDALRAAIATETEPTLKVRKIGKDAVSVPHRHRNGCGVGILRHPISRSFCFLRTGRLHDRHVADVCAHQRYCVDLHRQQCASRHNARTP